MLWAVGRLRLRGRHSGCIHGPMGTLHVPRINCILFIVCLNLFQFGGRWDVLGYEDDILAASMGPWEPWMFHG